IIFFVIFVYMKKFNKLPNIPGLVEVKKRRIEICQYSLFPPQISFQQNNLTDVYVFSAFVQEQTFLFYTHKQDPTNILQFENKELFDMFVNGQLYSSYREAYRDKKITKKFAKKMKLPFAIYMGKIEEYKQKRAKHKRENRPFGSIFHLVGFRADGMLLYGREGETGGSSTVLIHAKSIINAINTEEIIAI
ncbi:MAG: hypothetical protein ACC656_00490, partial [Candidatus Heimdallarchaeota archaeon]